MYHMLSKVLSIHCARLSLSQQLSQATHMQMYYAKYLEPHKLLLGSLWVLLWPQQTCEEGIQEILKQIGIEWKGARATAKNCEIWKALYKPH